MATLFFFIWFSNMLGYIPLPVNSEETINIFGIDFPAFSLYAATANLSIPLVLTLTVFILYQVEGIRKHGLIKYLKGWLPAGVTGPAAVPIFFIEVISQFMRIISLSVRLFANILAGHLLILFMGGGLAVLLGIAALGVDHAAGRDRLLPARGRPDRDAAGLHLCDAHIHLLRRGIRRRPLRRTNGPGSTDTDRRRQPTRLTA